MIRMKLRELLEARGKTIYWLGKETGLTTKNLYAINNNLNKEISYETLNKICEALDCEPGDLLVREREVNQANGTK